MVRPLLSRRRYFSVVEVLEQRTLLSAAPLVSLQAPEYAADGIVALTVATAAPGTIEIDVDLNHDGRFQGPSELGYAQAPTGDVRVHGLIDGTYQLRARLLRAGEADVVSAVRTVSPPAATDMPVSFEPNLGQADSGVLFVGRAEGQMVYVTAADTTLVTTGGAVPEVQRFRLVGANAVTPMRTCCPRSATISSAATRASGGPMFPTISRW